MEITNGKPESAQLLNQIMQAWKDPHRTRLGQLIGGCTPKYIVWKGRKTKDIVLPSARMRVPVLDPIPKQPSEVDIIRLVFIFERLEMEQKYLRL